MTANERNELIDALLEGEISEADFLRLEAEFTVDPRARQEYYQRLKLSAALEVEAAAVGVPNKIVRPQFRMAARFRLVASLAAVVVLMAAGLGAWWGLRAFRLGAVTFPAAAEEKASGYAILAGQSDALWGGDAPLRDGALMPAGPLQLISGVAQIELFSGVTVIVEGAAEFEIVSPMEISLSRGKVRARVPEPARGFRVRTHDGEVVDLGTEFALDVSSTRSEVHVLDGDVEWHPRNAAARRMEKGDALEWEPGAPGVARAVNAGTFVDLAEIRAKIDLDRQARRASWEDYASALRRDPRLVVYFQMAGVAPGSRRILNESHSGAKVLSEGAVVAATRVSDRWNGPQGALDFSPTGSRVRLAIPGEFRSLTLFCWVKINSLDRQYNSLFLTDGHDLNEPHWQIRDDGRLFFSVKKRNAGDASKGRKEKHIFHSPPFWNSSLSGQWLMIATVYDVDAKRVTHYLNGRLLSEESVAEEYVVEAVSIGAASLGNWGLPERNDPHFAVRNLNGSMDEFALFAAALTPQEIAEIFEHGRP